MEHVELWVEVLICFGLFFVLPMLCIFIPVWMKVHEAKEMRRQGYVREFVISCSADPGSWQWVKPR